MSRIRRQRLSTREAALVSRAAIDGIDYAADRCVGAARSGLVDLNTGPGAAMEIARRLRVDARRCMGERSRIRRKGA